MKNSNNKKIKKIEDIKIVKPTRQRGGDNYYNFGIEEILQKFATSKHGLKQTQVDERIKKFGKNELPSQPRAGWVTIFISQFQSSLVYILIFAALISFLIEEFIDAYVILAAITINVIVGFFQEYKAQRALEALQKIIVHNVWVIRDGMERQIESKDLVLGDVVVISAGDKIAADGRLFEAEHLKINESSLTGESQSVDKITRMIDGEKVISERHNMVFSGTIATEGHGRFFVTRIGEKTEIGKIASLVKEIKEVRTPLQKKLDSFSRYLAVFVLFLSIALIAVGIWRGYDLSDMFIISVAIAVSVIPEGLVVGVTVILAVGMQRILRKRSLVRKLVAAETLGSVNVICADKTGTITLGEMRVVRLVTQNHDIDINKENKSDIRNLTKQAVEIKKMHYIAAYCNNAILASAEPKKSTQKGELTEEITVGSPTEKALILSAIDGDFDEAGLYEERPRFDEIPFDSKTKFMATLNSWTKNQHVLYIKGAPEKILSTCSRYQDGRSVKNMSDVKRKEFVKIYQKMSSLGLRVLAGGYKGVGINVTSFDEMPDYNEDIIFVGFWGIKDPIRPEARQTLENTLSAGIRTIIITGDNKNTALAIAKELGMDAKEDEIIDGSDLASISALELSVAVKSVKVFSRTGPEDKLRIIDALQKNGDIVAMTGDGVNDAPALSKADIGLALGSGTDVAKESSDVIILDSNFSTIVEAVKQGRVIFDNIKKVILYLLSDSFSEVIIIMAGLLFGWPLALLPAQILWINLVTDGLPNLALTQEPEEDEVMAEDPIKRDEPILDFERKFLIFFISVLTAISTIGLFLLYFKNTGDLEKARTIAFVTLGIDSLLYVFSVRSVRHSIFETRQFSNKWLLWAVAGGFAIQIIGVYAPFFQKVLQTVPISAFDWFVVVAVCLWVVAVIEIIKHYFISQRRVKII